MNLFELIRSRIADPKRPFLIGADGSTLSYGETVSYTHLTLPTTERV